MTAFAQAEVFGEQVTTNSLAQNIVYVSGTVGALVILAGLLMVDMGGVRRRNVFDSVIQKLIGFFIGFVVYFLIGFAIWNWQYYVAFDIPDPYWQSVKDWWLGGSLRARWRRPPTRRSRRGSTTSRSSSSSWPASRASSTC